MSARVFLVGRLTEEVKARKVKDNTVANFTVVCNTRNKTEYINCTSWNKLATRIEENTNKNMLVEVIGSWTTSTRVIDNKYKAIDSYVTVDDIQFLEAKRKEVNLFDLVEANEEV